MVESDPTQVQISQGSVREVSAERRIVLWIQMDPFFSRLHTFLKNRHMLRVRHAPILREWGG